MRCKNVLRRFRKRRTRRDVRTVYSRSASTSSKNPPSIQKTVCGRELFSLPAPPSIKKSPEKAVKQEKRFINTYILSRKSGFLFLTRLLYTNICTINRTLTAIVL